MRLFAALPLLLTGLIAGCATPVSSGDPGSTTNSEPRVQTETPSQGWRWESYGGIELQVPDTYRWKTSGSPLYPAWCAGPGVDGKPVAGVNRLSDQVMSAIGCPSHRPVSSYAPTVDLASHTSVGTVRREEGWVSETVDVADVKVTVSDNDDARRRRIVRSVRPVGETDAHGCPPSSGIAQPGARPSTTAPTAHDVTAVAICRYALPAAFGAAAPPKPLVSSSRLSGADATDLVRAIQAAPEGDGPNSPSNCARSVAFGGEVVVLRVETATGLHEVVVRYSGCDGHGTDDGTTTRTLTSDVLTRVLAGPNLPAALQANVGALLGS